jgi:hypothetical protein
VQGAASVTGNISNWYVLMSVAPGTGNQVVWTWRKAAVDQTVTCTIANLAKSCSDTTNIFSADAGDLIDFKGVVSGAGFTGVVVSSWGLPGLAGPGGAKGDKGDTGAAGPTVYPGAGIPVSPGVGGPWSTSKATPTGVIVGDSDTQTLTNKTVDSVTPTVFGYLDPTSSVQTQLNGKQASLGFTAVPNTRQVAGHALSSDVTITSSDVGAPHTFLGTAAPGSVTGNLPGDRFTDTTNHHDYVCNAPSGTVAPACTSVTAAGWKQVDSGGASIPATTSALAGDGAGNASAVTGTGTNCVHVDGTSAACPGGGVADPGANGFTTRTSLNVLVARTLSCTSGVACTNPDGVAGAPGFTSDPNFTVAVTDDIANKNLYCADQNSSAGVYGCPNANPAHLWTAYTTGARVLLRANSSSTGACTLNISGLGAKNCYNADGTTLSSLTSGQTYWYSYDATLNSSAGGFRQINGGATGTGNTTSTTLTTNRLPKANGANSVIDSSLSDDGTTVTSTEPISITGDGVHAGLDSVGANTTVPLNLPANSEGFIGANSASLTSLFFQLPVTPPGTNTIWLLQAPVNHASCPSSSACLVTGDTFGKLTSSYVDSSIALQANQLMNVDSTLGASTGAGSYIPGTSLTAGDVYYWGASGLAVAEANVSTTVPGVCIAVSTTQCAFSGVYRFSGSQSWTSGNIIYVSDTSAGALLNSAPTTSGHYVQRVGIALANDTLLIMPSVDVGGIQ